MGLPESLVKTLNCMQFQTPTPIQAAAIPLALQGKDILGSAQTGTGKTGAFGIPLVAKILLNPTSSALVITPTRELATQVTSQLHAMIGQRSTIKTALLIGGAPMSKQLMQLDKKPRIIVGTPGRINDHLQRASLMLHTTDFLVLDETDRMLDMGFSKQIEAIMQCMAAKRQTLLFSATLPPNIVRIATHYLNDPARVSVDTRLAPPDHIQQETRKLGEQEKYPALVAQLNQRNGGIIVFVKTKYGAEKMAKILKKDGHHADAIHGNLRQSKRDRILSDFRNKKYRILVATDVAARGIDVPHVDHVINYDVPQCPEDYIHRIGRTARAGNQGCSLTFITPEDKKKWNAVDRLLNPNASQDAPYTPKSPPGKRHPKKRVFGRGTKPYAGHRHSNTLGRKKRTPTR